MNIKQITKNTDNSFEIKADAIPMPKGNAADNNKPIIIIEVHDERTFDDDPRAGAYACGGTLRLG